MTQKPHIAGHRGCGVPTSHPSSITVRNSPVRSGPVRYTPSDHGQTANVYTLNLPDRTGPDHQKITHGSRRWWA